jgi:hypothetical protein
MFGFVRLVAKPFMRRSETTPSNIAGTPSSLQDRVRATKRYRPEVDVCEAKSNPLCVPAVNELGFSYAEWAD